jgi:hypothetical protein
MPGLWPQRLMAQRVPQTLDSRDDGVFGSRSSRSSLRSWPSSCSTEAPSPSRALRHGSSVHPLRAGRCSGLTGSGGSRPRHRRLGRRFYSARFHLAYLFEALTLSPPSTSSLPRRRLHRLRRRLPVIPAVARRGATSSTKTEARNQRSTSRPPPRPGAAKRHRRALSARLRGAAHFDQLCVLAVFLFAIVAGRPGRTRCRAAERAAEAREEFALNVREPYLQAISMCQDLELLLGMSGRSSCLYPFAARR